MAISYSSTQSRLDALVDDVLIHILSLLPVWDVLHLRQTSKRMEALSHVCAVWRALFARDVLTYGRPIPGFSFAPTPRLLELCALNSSSDHLDDTESQYCEKYDIARELIEASDLEARTLHALRLDKAWNTSVSATSVTMPDTHATESRLCTFQTPTPVRDVFLLPGGRFVVSLHADRLRCWDLGVPHVLSTSKSHASPTGVRCVGELLLSRSLSEATMCMDAHPFSPSVSVYGRHSETSMSFVLCPDPVLFWNTTPSRSSSPSEINTRIQTRRGTCEILSVHLDPLRFGPTSNLHLHGSPFASHVPFFRREATIRLPEELITPAYPEGSVSAQTMVGPQWGPQRFARGKLGRLVMVYGSVMFFESFVPPEPATAEGEEEEERRPKYVGIEVMDWNEPTSSVLFEYPDPQVGPYIGMHVYAAANQVLVVWQNCTGLYPLPFRETHSSSLSRSSSSSSLSLSGSTTGSTSSKPSCPFISSESDIASRKFSSPPETSSPSPTPFFSSPGLPRSSLGLDGAHVSPSDVRFNEEEDVNIGFDQADQEKETATDANYIPESESVLKAEQEVERKRVVTMPTIIFALSEPIEAPIAFSLCSGPEVKERNDYEHRGQDPHPHPLTILARSRTHPTRTVQSVLTSSTNPHPSPSSSLEDEKYIFRLSRIPSSSPSTFSEDSTSAEVITALALGSSGRGVRADVSGTLFRCTRAEAVLPRYGFGFGGLGGFGGFGGVGASAVPTVDFWPWKFGDVLPPSQNQVMEEGRLLLRFDDGMGRVVSARVPEVSNGFVQRTSEVAVLDFA